SLLAVAAHEDRARIERGAEEVATVAVTQGEMKHPHEAVIERVRSSKQRKGTAVDPNPAEDAPGEGVGIELVRWRVETRRAEEAIGRKRDDKVTVPDRSGTAGLPARNAPVVRGGNGGEPLEVGIAPDLEASSIDREPRVGEIKKHPDPAVDAWQIALALPALQRFAIPAQALREILEPCSLRDPDRRVVEMRSSVLPSRANRASDMVVSRAEPHLPS